MEIPNLFEPAVPLKTIDLDINQFFPPDDVSRWALGLMSARNDIGIAQKLVYAYLEAPTLSDKNLAWYRTSHSIYFWRLYMGHIYEAWKHFNKLQGISHPVAKHILESDRVVLARRSTSDLIGKLFENQYSVGSFAERCRAAIFHYWDDEGNKWENQLKILDSGLPAMLVPHGDRAVDSRWVIADEFVLSRLNDAGFGCRELHRDGLVPLQTTMLDLIDAGIDSYLDARNHKK